jgi:SAM-dependent methyltransferase
VQQAVFNLQGQESESVYEGELRKPALLGETRSRLETQLAAVRANIAELNGLIDPLLTEDATGVSESAPAPNPEEVEPLISYFELLLRDWGWSPDENDENARATALIEDAVAKTGNANATPGHVLVLGSGAGRLAYELHVAHRPSSTTTIDIDLILSAVADRMVRGQSLPLTEAPSDANQNARLSSDRTLRAPRGALTDFQVLLADGLNPPFAAESFDTVLTPWFIDQVPPDVRNLLGVIHRLLKPGGRWINFGPLIYRKRTPLSQSFTIEEIVALAELAGFDVAPAVQGDWRYLCSPLKARGRHEISFAFCATKSSMENARVTPDGQPSWLVLPHLPIPVFAGSALLSHPHPVYRRVLERLNGNTSIADIAGVLGKQAEMNPVDLYDSIRAILIEVHPAAKSLRATHLSARPES